LVFGVLRQQKSTPDAIFSSYSSMFNGVSVRRAPPSPFPTLYFPSHQTGVEHTYNPQSAIDNRRATKTVLEFLKSPLRLCCLYL